MVVIPWREYKAPKMDRARSKEIMLRILNEPKFSFEETAAKRILIIMNAPTHDQKPP